MGAGEVMGVIPQVELRPIDSLVAYARNARTHSPAQIEEIERSILEFGWTVTILADASGIVAGHGRTVALDNLHKRGATVRFLNDAVIPPGMAPVMDCSGWSPAQRKAYIIADNKLAQNAGWDEELLKLELLDLQDEGFDLSLTGFHEDELSDLFAPGEMPSDKDPDDVPEVPEVPFSQLGDMWVCGPHRVRCGSSTSPEDWAALMQGELADLQVCDPPYNVAFESKLAGSIKNDDMSDSKFREFLLGFYQCSYKVMKPGAAMYVAHADSEGANFRGALKEAGFALKSCLIWVKNSLVLGRGDFHYKHEPILYATKPGAPRKWWGDRKQTPVQELGEGSPFELMPDGRYGVRNGDAIMYVSADAVVEEAPSTLIHHNKPKRSAAHPTMKPVGLWEKLARFNGRAGDIMIDGFGGSGTTLMTADRLGMFGRLMELDPKFVDVICVRYAMYTGRVPVHAVTGEPFPRDVIDRLSPKLEGDVIAP
jgi:DNA modification methylase